MAGVSKFEDLIAWQKARMLVQQVYVLCRKSEVACDFGFCNQLRTAAISAMSNIAEGFERQSQKEFARFLDISIASCAEVRSQLYAALDLAYASDAEFEMLQKLANDVSYLTKALCTSVANRI